MLKRGRLMIILVIVMFLQNCKNRDEKGNTDANNTNTIKRNTDSTRGDSSLKNSSSDQPK